MKVRYYFKPVGCNFWLQLPSPALALPLNLLLWEGQKFKTLAFDPSSSKLDISNLQLAIANLTFINVVFWPPSLRLKTDFSLKLVEIPVWNWIVLGWRLGTCSSRLGNGVASLIVSIFTPPPHPVESKRRPSDPPRGRLLFDFDRSATLANGKIIFSSSGRVRLSRVCYIRIQRGKYWVRGIFTWQTLERYLHFREKEKCCRSFGRLYIGYCCLI